MRLPHLLVLAILVALLGWALDTRGPAAPTPAPGGVGSAVERGELELGGPGVPQAPRDVAGEATALLALDPGGPRVVDASAGDPVPWLEVELDGRPYRTDAEGRLPAGVRGRLTVVGEPELSAPLEDTVALPIGPTFRIAVALPHDRLREDFVLLPVSAHPTMALATGLLQPVPLREDGGVLWGRFSAPIADPGPWTLTLRSQDWLFTGRAPFERPAGRVDVALTLDARGALRVRLVDEATLTLRCLEPDAPGQVERFHLAPGDRLLPGLFPGRYAVEAGSPRHRPLETEALVVAGEVRQLSLALERLPLGGDVAGTVTSPGGSYHRTLNVELQRHDGALLRVPVLWEQAPDLSWNGSFRFEDVPAGEWELRPAAHSWHRITPVSQVLEPPAAVALEVDDAGTQRGLGFHISDALSSATLAGFIAHFEGETGAYHRLHGARSGAQVLPDWIEGAPVRWRVEVAGYRSAQGTEADFVEPGDGGRTLFARVALEREEF